MTVQSKGNLSNSEIDKLFEEFMKNPTNKIIMEILQDV